MNRRQLLCVSVAGITGITGCLGSITGNSSDGPGGGSDGSGGGSNGPNRGPVEVVEAWVEAVDNCNYDRSDEMLHSDSDIQSYASNDEYEKRCEDADSQGVGWEIEDTELESKTDQRATVSGTFIITSTDSEENSEEIDYILEKEDGEWKILDLE